MDQRYYFMNNVFFGDELSDGKDIII